MSNKVDIIINKRNINSKLTDYDIDTLRANIKDVQKVFDIFFDKACAGKNNFSSKEIAKQIRSEIGSDIDTKFCLGRISSNTTVTTSSVDVKALVNDATNAKDNTTKLLPALANKALL